MASEYHENYVGDLALSRGLISAQQLEECKKLRSASSPPKSLARVLLEKGHLTDEQLGQLLAEYKLLVGRNFPDESDPGSIAFGEAAVKKGLVKNVNVWDAIDERAHRKAGGAERRLGQILVEQGTLAISQAQEILESQGKQILKCADCAHQYSVRDYNPNKEYTCLNCGGPLSLPEAVSSLDVAGMAVDSQTVKRDMDDRFVGREIGGCEILQKLGEGGMGAVYKARHIALNKVVAVKIMSRALMGEIHRKRFLREARAAAQLEHMNIVQVHDTGEGDGFNYIVMQFIDGESLQKKLTKQGEFGQKEALRIIRAAADALSFAHKRHMIHRDIKPDNIMVTTENVVKVADFGLVKSTEIEKDLTGMSQSMLMGTPHYMSPEQFEGKIIDQRTDIYSLGVTLYYMLTGQRPYDGTTPYQIMQGHLQQEFVDPSNLSEDIYPAVSQLVRKMMARERERRYPDCEQLIADIDKVLAGFEDGTIATEDFIIVEDDELGPTVQAPAAGRAEVVGKKAPPVKAAGAERKKKSALVIILPAVILVAVVVVLLAYFLAGGPKEENGEEPVVVGPEKPLQPDQKEAELAFRQAKRKADQFADEDKFADAMAQWEGFVPRWGKDPWESKVAIERADILQRALERIKKLLSSGALEDLKRALQEANSLNNLEPNEQLVSAAREADEKLKGLESAEDTLKRKRKEFEEADKRAQGLVKQDKLDEARAVYDPKYTGSEIKEIETKALSRVAEIDSLLAARRKQWEDYRAAEEEARRLTDSHQYADAKVAYLPFTGQKYLAQIREDAQKKISQIEQAWQDYDKGRFDLALGLAQEQFKRGSYSNAREALRSYLNHPNEEFAARAGELDEKIRTYENFREQMNTVDSYRDSGRYTEALTIASRYAASENEDFSKVARKKVEQIRRERYLGKNLVFIDGGEIPIGSDDPRDRNPGRVVKIEPFYMDHTEVTNARYEEFIKDTRYRVPLHWAGGRPPRGKANHPVIWVTVRDAMEYCKWRSKREGVTFRLPTESEWEYAASYDPGAEKKYTYPWGDEFDSSCANLSGGKTQPAGSNTRDKSPLGIYDMAGNVAEWTTSDDKSAKAKYVVRGGAVSDTGDPQTARVSFRHKTDPNTKGAGIGFRCVREE